MDLVPERLKRCPNTKMFLRSFWYRATLKGLVNAAAMHIYTLARWVEWAGCVGGWVGVLRWVGAARGWECVVGD